MASFSPAAAEEKPRSSRALVPKRGNLDLSSEMNLSCENTAAVVARIHACNSEDMSLQQRSRFDPANSSAVGRKNEILFYMRS